MGKLVVVGILLLVLAVGFVAWTQAGETAALLDAFLALPPLSQASWIVIVLVPLALLAYAAWLSYALVVQRSAARALEVRLNGVRDETKELIKAQVGSEESLHRLARTDPEDALAEMQRRLTEAERFAQVQQTRNEAADLQSRVEYIRAQQKALKERLGPILEKRRAIEQLFMELDSHQNDLDRTLDEIASGDDAVALDISLKKMIEFIKRSHGRCDDLERAAKTIAELKQDYAQLGNRLMPLADGDGGISGRLGELRDARDRLVADIDSLQQTPEGPLAERVHRFGEDRKALDRRIGDLNEEFSKLAVLRREIAGLFANFNRALDALAIPGIGDNASAIDARIADLAKFVDATQTHIDDIEHRIGVFAHLKAKLGEVQLRLDPLESETSGVVRAVEEVREIRDKLAAKIRRMEESEDGDLAERVRRFTESKRELEHRVSLLNEQFLRLAAIRKDIAGLFEKLSNAVSTSAN